MNEEYNIIDTFAKNKHYSIDKIFFIYLRLIRLARDHEIINNALKSPDFDYLKDLLPNIFHDIYKAKKLLNKNKNQSEKTDINHNEEEIDYQSFLDFENYLY